MKKTETFSFGALLILALAAGAYAAQGQEGAGGISGQPSAETGMTPGSPAQPAPDPSLTPGTAGRPTTIEGEVLRIEGDYYIVKDTSGKEVRLHVDKSTKLDGNITAHDLITARTSEMPPSVGTTPPDKLDAWHAESIKKR